MDKEYTPAEAKAWLAGYDAGKAHAKKEWQGLTDEQLLDLADMAYVNDLELLQTLQVKLKEKNI